MKRIALIGLVAGLLPLQITPAQACGAGQGSGVDVNATTQVVTYFCYDIVPPSQAQLEQEARQRIEQTLSQQANSNPITRTIESSVVVTEPYQEPAERPRVMEVNATTGEVIVRDYNDAEMAQWRIDRATYLGQQQAYEVAKSNATAGVNACVEWFAFEMGGTVCHYEPVPISNEQIDYQYDFLYELWSPGWYEMLWSWLR